MAMDVADSSAANALERGATPQQAAKVSTIQGITAYLGGKVGLDAIFKGNKIVSSAFKGQNIKNVISSWLKGAAIEGGEEGIEKAVEIASDVVVMKDKSEL
ncbi:MAG: hypothetical protein RR234_04380, partial [Christensenella sp.]